MKKKLKSSAEIFRELLREKGIKDSRGLYASNEDQLLSDNTTSESGHLLSSDGKIYHYWFEWDSNKINPETGEKGYYTLGDNKFLPDGTPYFAEFTPEEYQKIQNDPEYLEAKKKLGIK